MTACDLAQQREPLVGSALDQVAHTMLTALKQIPTGHIQECFERALQNDRAGFPISSALVLRAYDDMKPELQRVAKEYAANQAALLEEGHGSLFRMFLDEWRQRHNLPTEWKPGDPFPPTSDLHGKPVPAPLDGPYRCNTCKDAGWLRVPFNREAQYCPPPVKCKCKGGRG